MSVVLLLIALVMTVTPPVGAQEPGQGSATVTRVGTGDRVQAASLASQAVYPAGAESVLIVSVEDYADALSAASLAGLSGAPVLYAERLTLPEATAAEIRRLGATRAILLGGQNALSPAVAAQVTAAGVIDVSRIAGANRFATAGAVAEQVVQSAGTTRAFLTLGSHPDAQRAWADAVAVSALAARSTHPILLTTPDSLPAETAQTIRSSQIDHLTIIGGTAAITSAVEDELRELGVTVDRLAGASRYETSLAVTSALMRIGAVPGELWVSSGGNFSDPLIAGPAAARLGGVMMLADSTGFQAQPLPTFLAQNRAAVRAVRVLGGETAFGEDILEEMRRILGSGIPADAVLVTPGQPITDLFEDHPPGTPFAFLPGVHHHVSVSARSGDAYLGFPGAVLDGSSPLPRDAFVRRDGRWVATGVISTLPTGGSYGCLSWLEDPDQFALCGHEQEVHRSEQLFLGDRRLRHVNSIPDVDRPGTWFYDAGEGAVHMFDDPSSDTVRMSDTAVAFAGYQTTDVTIAGLRIVRYGSPSRLGAIDAMDTDRWTITGTTISQSHGYGVRIGHNTSVTDSQLLDNGQLGIGGSAFDTPAIVVGNEIARNGELGFQRNYEIGGLKITHSVDSLIAENDVHDNAAKGLWLDGLNRGAVMRDNVVQRSGQTGILYEISYDARIHGNVLIDNHTDDTTTESYGSLQVVNSRNVEVFDNVMRGGGRQELTIYDTDLYPGVGNVWVHGNDITIDTSWDEGTYGLKDLRADKSTPIPDVRFEGNTVRVIESAERPFAWDSQLVGASDWLAVHHEDRILGAP